jgi:hypothetical protein
MLGGYAHLPDSEVVGVDASRCILLLLYHFLRVIHCLTFSDVDSEGTVRTVENPTEEGELIICANVWASFTGLTGDCLPVLDRSDSVGSIDQVEAMLIEEWWVRARRKESGSNPLHGDAVTAQTNN